MCPVNNLLKSPYLCKGFLIPYYKSSRDPQLIHNQLLTFKGIKHFPLNLGPPNAHHQAQPFFPKNNFLLYFSILFIYTFTSIYYIIVVNFEYYPILLLNTYSIFFFWVLNIITFFFWVQKLVQIFRLFLYLKYK